MRSNTFNPSPSGFWDSCFLKNCLATTSGSPFIPDKRCVVLLVWT